MNTMNSNPKTDFLLGAGLDILHQESNEWLDTIAFWKDETRFFAKLLQKKKIKNGTEPEYAKMLDNLDRLHAELFDYLAEDIIKHEKVLARLQKGEKGLADADYRQKHRELKKKMEVFTSDFREFKKMVFGYVKAL
ncbi:hypothetical protein [Flagellimonas lutaonensis]|uniref:Uncharacterized protein n=1 Tax=Flagellimonas lutaonensis TaxID=516051 RepID=A0A0D5YQM5_9FLAO|nr:hypothetical protein [Allomuricauda lutaonensis]AKA34229.1 hypothetical protein VC82_555 [Allomuricauda lutaonensis]